MHIPETLQDLEGLVLLFLLPDPIQKKVSQDTVEEYRQALQFFFSLNMCIFGYIFVYYTFLLRPRYTLSKRCNKMYLISLRSSPQKFCADRKTLSSIETKEARKMNHKKILPLALFFVMVSKRNQTAHIFFFF